LAETKVAQEIGEAYAHLKTVLLAKGCRITAEHQPTSVEVMQGSLWGIMPKTAKKIVVFQLSAAEKGMRIASTSKLSSGYMKFAVAGCVFAVALAVLCVWISLDLAAFAASQSHSVWSWLAEAGGYVDVQGAVLLSGLTQTFAVFLTIMLVLETCILLLAKLKVDSFAEEVLRDSSLA
jgi:hypothetical protein